MRAQPHIENVKRLAALDHLQILDSGEETVYKDIVELTAELCEVPISVIGLVDENRQWFKSEIGLGLCESHIDQSICAHAILEDDILEIADTLLDERTRGNPWCEGKQPVRFYAGAILRTLDGWPLGTLCVLDYKPRKLTDLQRRILKVNANSVTRQLELTRALLENVSLSSPNRDTSLVSEAGKKQSEETRRLFETLTPREKEVMELIAGRSGNLSSKQIARELDISHRTVDHHRAKILLKMNAGSVAEIIAVSLKAGLFEQLGSFT